MQETLQYLIAKWMTDVTHSPIFSMKIDLQTHEVVQQFYCAFHVLKTQKRAPVRGPDKHKIEEGFVVKKVQKCFIFRPRGGVVGCVCLTDIDDKIRFQYSHCEDNA